jgi:DNA-binding transcriptional regulator YiaG
MEYAKLIKKLRDKLILSQTEFAALLGISYTTVSRWESGLHEPTIKMKRKIAELCRLNKIDMEG